MSLCGQTQPRAHKHGAFDMKEQRSYYIALLKWNWQRLSHESLWWNVHNAGRWCACPCFKLFHPQRSFVRQRSGCWRLVSTLAESLHHVLQLPSEGVCRWSQRCGWTGGGPSWRCGPHVWVRSTPGSHRDTSQVPPPVGCIGCVSCLGWGCEGSNALGLVVVWRIYGCDHSASTCQDSFWRCRRGCRCLQEHNHAILARGHSPLGPCWWSDKPWLCTEFAGFTRKIFIHQPFFFF